MTNREEMTPRELRLILHLMGKGLPLPKTLELIEKAKENLK